MYNFSYFFIPVVKIALIQLAVGPNKDENLSRAKELARTAAQNGAVIISLPVCT